MGTNFYLNNELYGTENESDPSCHAGKRSASGLWCWDCGVTLCRGGIERIHYGRLEDYERDWYDRCPKCKQRPAEENLDVSSAGRELGFNSSKPRRKTGVRSCSSFTWAFAPEELSQRVATVQRSLLIDAPIMDEYGRSYTLEEFLQILEECPVRFTHHIGVNFS